MDRKPFYACNSPEHLVSRRSFLAGAAAGTLGALGGFSGMVHPAAANELRPRGISVAVVSPGWVRTDMGGAGAALDVKESAAGIRKVIDKLNVGISGQFFNYSGENLPW